MSVAFDSTTDTLRAVIPTLTVTTGPIMESAWFRKTSNQGVVAEIFMVADAIPPTGIQRTGFLSLFDNTLVGYYGNGVTSATVLSPTLNTNYGLVVSRDGTNIRFRVFLDDVGLTKSVDFTEANTDNINALDNVLLGTRGSGNASQLMELSNYKIHTHSSEWTDAECRTELTKFGIQKAGGTDRYCWGLETIDADTYGLNGVDGGVALTNSGCVNGSNRPTQLEDVPSGGVDIGPNTRPFEFGDIRTNPAIIRTTARNQFRFVPR